MNNQNRFSKIFGLIFGILGLAFLLFGAVLLYIYQYLSGNTDFMILAYTFIPMGGVFAVIGICSLSIALAHKRKVKRLMKDGVCYDAEIVRLYEKPYTRINYRSPFAVECGYKDRRGRTYLVKSGNVWMDHFAAREDIKAKVWVNADNPRDYFVEVYSGSDSNGSNMKFDFDYR